ncbi:hypothetical protein HMPREF0322_04512 [Desulfitobacterium hafniense DP7]|uniref:Uncharacterized protein n=1 Tax=Desulfitobacterium hafniense DP7 TaxID=537010 RepID=G9XU54_DESHA|nr:hypothetical protein [Desulfitobacterium hafniense]EHL04837.1 hypothetical protein HMPREF0322_04512 [Desulfitobacterium hafniense DP7]
MEELNYKLLHQNIKKALSEEGAALFIGFGVSAWRITELEEAFREKQGARYLSR